MEGRTWATARGQLGSVLTISWECVPRTFRPIFFSSSYPRERGRYGVSGRTGCTRGIVGCGTRPRSSHEDARDHAHTVTRIRRSWVLASQPTTLSSLTFPVPRNWRFRITGIRPRPLQRSRFHTSGSALSAHPSITHRTQFIALSRVSVGCHSLTKCVLVATPRVPANQEAVVGILTAEEKCKELAHGEGRTRSLQIARVS